MGEPTQQTSEDIAYEKKFTRENTWRNFKMALFGAISGATFIAALSVLAQKIVAASEGLVGEAVKAGAKAAGDGSFLSTLFTNPALTLPLLGGMVVVGVASAYAGVAEGTEIKRLQDDRLARQNAREQERCHEREHSRQQSQPEYPQNVRQSNGKWEDSIVKTSLVPQR